MCLGQLALSKRLKARSASRRIEAQHHALAQAFNRIKALALSTVLIGGKAVRNTKGLSSRSRFMR